MLPVGGPRRQQSTPTGCGALKFSKHLGFRFRTHVSITSGSTGDRFEPHSLHPGPIDYRLFESESCAMRTGGRFSSYATAGSESLQPLPVSLHACDSQNSSLRREARQSVGGVQDIRSFEGIQVPPRLQLVVFRRPKSVPLASPAALPMLFSPKHLAGGNK